MKVTVDDLTITIPTQDSPKDMWKVYYRTLRENFSKLRTHEIFLTTWQYNGSYGHTTDPEFNEFFADKGLNLPTTSAGMIADVRSTLGFIGNIVETGIKIGVYAVPVVGGITVLIILYFLFRTAKDLDVNKAVSSVASLKSLK
jgi:hypothetical protein